MPFAISNCEVTANGNCHCKLMVETLQARNNIRSRARASVAFPVTHVYHDSPAGQQVSF